VVSGVWGASWMMGAWGDLVRRTGCSCALVLVLMVVVVLLLFVVVCILR